ncbi:MAG: arylsulfotransferase family protein [Desulfobacterales bacterium]|jgi:hypothetical protein
MFKWKKEIIRTAALLYLVASLFFVWGIAAGHFKIFPFKQLYVIYAELKAYLTFKDGPNKSAFDKLLLGHQESRTRFGVSGLVIRDSDFQDTGYLLISRYSKSHKQVIIELFSISENSVLHTWVPPLDEIFQQAPSFSDGFNRPVSYRAQHPLLLDDGGLIFTSGEGPMVRMEACGDLVWVIERHFHHSIELDHAGNIVCPIVIKGKNSDELLPIRDDGFAIVSMDGQILEEYSVTDILLTNGYRGLIYGVGKFERDRIHLNDAQPILRNSNNAKIGDIALSSRNISTVALYRPQSDKIIWLKTGPWLNQHDINQLEDGNYSIFGNDIVRQELSDDLFIDNGKSDIYIFDPLKNLTTQPYAEMMAEEKIGTETSGRSRVLANGDVYIEQSDYSRLIRISQNKVRWEYVNALSPDTVGAIHWSRYIAADELDLKWKESLSCD